MKKIFNANNLIMFIKFSCVGVLNTLIDNGVFFVLCDILNINIYFSNICGYILSATNSYFMNSLLVYKDKKNSIIKYAAFIAGNVSVLLISTAFIAVLSKYIEVKTVAKLISAPCTIILNFCFQRFVLFKKTADKISYKKNNGVD